MPRFTPRQALIAACLASGLLTAACASVAPTPYVDQAALTPTIDQNVPSVVAFEAE